MTSAYVGFAKSDFALAACFPIDLSGDVVALRASIDASTQDDGGVFTVAGVALGFDRAQKANSKWEQLMRGRTFHMTDLNARKKDFREIEDGEVYLIMEGIVGILRRYPSYMVAVSCNADLVRDFLPKDSHNTRVSEEMRNAFRSPYGVMCHLCMHGLGMYIRRAGGGRSISYILETGDEGQKGLIRYYGANATSSLSQSHLRHVPDPNGGSDAC